MKKYLTALCSIILCSIILCTVPSYAARWSCPSCTKEEMKTLFEKHAGAEKLDVMLQAFDRRLDANTNTLVNASSIAGICQAVWGIGGEGTAAWSKCSAFATDMVKLAKSKQAKKVGAVKTPAKATKFGGAVVCDKDLLFGGELVPDSCMSVGDEEAVNQYKAMPDKKVFDLQAEYDPSTGSWHAPYHDVTTLTPSTGAIVAFDNGGNIISVSENGKQLNLNDSEIKQKANAVVNSFKNFVKTAIGSGVLIVTSIADFVAKVFDLTKVLASTAINELKAKGVALGNKVEEIKNDAILSAKNAYRGAKVFVSDIGKKIVEYKDAAGRVAQDIYDKGGEFIATVVDGTVEAFNDMIEGMKKIAARIKATGDNFVAKIRRATEVTKEAIVFVTETSVGIIIVAYDEAGNLIKAGVSEAKDAATAYKEKFVDGATLIKEDFGNWLDETGRKAIAAKDEAVRVAENAFNAAKETALEKYETVENLVLDTVSATGRMIHLVYDKTGKMINATIDGVMQTANQVKDKVYDIYQVAQQNVADFVAKARARGAAAINTAKNAMVAAFNKVAGGIKAATDYQKHLVKVTVETAAGVIILAYDEMGQLKDAVVNATTEAAREYADKFSSGVEFIKQDLDNVVAQGAAKVREFKQAAVNRARAIAASAVGAGKYVWEATTQTGNNMILFFDQAGDLIEAKIDDAKVAVSEARAKFVDFVNVGIEKAHAAGEAFVNDLSRMASKVVEATKTGVKIGIGSVILAYDGYGNIQEAIIDGVRYSIDKMGSAMQNLAYNVKQQYANMWVKIGQKMEETGLALQEEYNMSNDYYQYAGN